MVVVLGLPSPFAVRVTVVTVVTEDVLTLNVDVDRLALTTVSLGTWATDGLLLERLTTAPWGMAAVNVTVPVALARAVTLVGVTETDFSVPPAGAAKLTDMLAVRGTLSTAAVICTPVGGAAALDVIVNVFSIVLAGTTMVGGTWAAFGSLLNSFTVVGSGSRNDSETVPVVLSPLFTVLGEIVMKFSGLAEALAGSARRSATNQKAERRRMVPPIGRLLPARWDSVCPSSIGLWSYDQRFLPAR